MPKQKLQEKSARKAVKGTPSQTLRQRIKQQDKEEEEDQEEKEEKEESLSQSLSKRNKNIQENKAMVVNFYNLWWSPILLYPEKQCDVLLLNKIFSDLYCSFSGLAIIS